MKRNWILLVIALFAVVLLPACAGSPAPASPAAPATTAPTTQSAAPTAAPTSQPAAPTAAATTQPAAATKAATTLPAAATTAPTAQAAAPTTAAAAQPAKSPTRGGTITVATSEPELLNFYIQTSGWAENVESFIQEPLIGQDDNGQYFPALAASVPTVENGGVTADGLVVTLKLKPGVVWSDGKPLTSEDVKFTWQAIMDPQSGAGTTVGYKTITSIDTPDAQTVVFHFKDPFPAYLTLFPFVLPKHASGEPAQMTKWPANRKPLGTGPFKLAEWSSGSHITLERNDLYREQGKPYLDKIVFKFVPSLDAALVMLQGGDVDVLYGATIDQMPAIKSSKNLVLDVKPSRWTEKWIFQLATYNKDGLPTPPHPILGDQKVRYALTYAMNRQRIVDNLLMGMTRMSTGPTVVGWARDESLKPWPYDVAKAKQLLDEAGWKEIGSDGIRVAKGAKYAKDGTRLSLRYQVSTGDRLREQIQQLLIEDAKAVGVELRVDNVANAVVGGSWEKGGTRKTGNFDILQYSTGPRIDPQDILEGFYHSANIPQTSNKGGGYNYSRVNDPELDKMLETAGKTMDAKARKALFDKIQERVVEMAPDVYLYDDLDVQAYNAKLQGWKHNVFVKQGWNSQDWWIAK